jgi:hypothetical protein
LKIQFTPKKKNVLDFEKNVKIKNPIYSKKKKDINPIVKPISAIYFSHGKEKRYCSKFFFSMQTQELVLYIYYHHY